MSLYLNYFMVWGTAGLTAVQVVIVLWFGEDYEDILVIKTVFSLLCFGLDFKLGYAET